MAVFFKNGRMAVTASAKDDAPSDDSRFHTPEEWEENIEDHVKAVGATPADAFAEMADNIYGKKPADRATVARRDAPDTMDALADRVYGRAPQDGSAAERGATPRAAFSGTAADVFGKRKPDAATRAGRTATALESMKALAGEARRPGRSDAPTGAVVAALNPVRSEIPDLAVEALDVGAIYARYNRRS